MVPAIQIEIGRKEYLCGSKIGTMRFGWVLLLFALPLAGQHSLRKLPFPVNTDFYNEICPVFSNDEKTMFFTRVGSPDFNKTLIVDEKDLFSVLTLEAYYDKLSTIFGQIAGRNVPDPVHTGYNQDIHVAIVDRDTLRRAYHPGYPLNNALPNSICTPTPESNTFIVINQFESRGGMREGFSRVVLDDNFESTFPERIQIDEFDRNAHEVNLTMAPDGGFIILAMAREVDQPKDLYLCERLEDKHYSKPLPLWRVNTVWDEATPFISKDGQRLFFASDRPGGNGGKDIYYCDRQNTSAYQWKEAICLKPPVNTTFNEAHPCVFRDGDRIYFTSDRDGNSDIFTARLNRARDFQKIKINIEAIKEDGTKFPAEISWGPAEEGADIEWLGYFRSRDGRHSVYIEKNQPFYMVAENRGIRTELKMIEPQDLIDQGIHEITIQLTMKPKGKITTASMVTMTNEESVLPANLRPGVTTVLHNLYFEQASAVLKTESLPEIKKLAQALLRNPGLGIVIEGHTDNVGDKTDLLNLSRNRAETIRYLLLREGVAENRVSTKGYGDTQPVSDNSTEEKRQKNRRVEIRIKEVTDK